MDKYWLQGAHRAAFEYAKATTAHYSKSFYWSARFLPEDRRWATFAVYGFCRFVDNIVDAPRSRSYSDLRAEVESVRRELVLAFRTGESEHPVIGPFAIAAHRFGIERRFAEDLLDGVLMDCEYNSYATFDELYVFCYRVAAVVGLMMTPVLGCSAPERAYPYAEKLGVAMQLTNILRDVAEDAGRGRIYLPLDELEAFGVCEKDIFSGIVSDNFLRLMEFQVARARRYYDEATPGIALLNPATRFSVTSAHVIYGKILDRLALAGNNPFLGRAVVPTSEKLRVVAREIVCARLGIDTTAGFRIGESSNSVLPMVRVS